MHTNVLFYYVFLVFPIYICYNILVRGKMVIAPTSPIIGRRGVKYMSDYELLSLMLVVLGLVVTILLHYIDSKDIKK